MKSRNLLAAMFSLALGIGAQAGAESLSTADGTTYDNITMKRVDPDGIYIEYAPAGGGLGMSKIKFARLSDDQRKQFGYDEAKTKAYEAQYAKGLAAWSADNARMEQDSRARIAAEQAQARQEAAMENERILALAQLKQAEAELARATGGGAGMGSETYGYGELGGAGVVVAIPQTGRVSPPETRYAPVARPFVHVIDDRAPVAGPRR